MARSLASPLLWFDRESPWREPWCFPGASAPLQMHPVGCAVPNAAQGPGLQLQSRAFWENAENSAGLGSWSLPPAQRIRPGQGPLRQPQGSDRRLLPSPQLTSVRPRGSPLVGVVGAGGCPHGMMSASLKDGRGLRRDFVLRPRDWAVAVRVEGRLGRGVYGRGRGWSQ